MRRPCSRRLAALAAAALLALAAAPEARAQDPRPPRPPAPRDTLPRPRPDTLPRDSAVVRIPGEAVRQDTLPERPGGDTAAVDTTAPAPIFPLFPDSVAGGYGAAVWNFTREELRYFHGLTVLELLDRIPGILIVRSGSTGRPAGVSPYGLGGGRFRVFIDGWESRPLNAAAPDLQRFQLVDLRALRVERDFTEVRVFLETFRLPDARPYAGIEGADGDYDSRILRGFFTRPIGSRIVAEVGLDLAETDGFLRREPFTSNTVLAKLSYRLRPDLGFQLEYRGQKVDAEREVASSGFGAGGRAFLESLDRTEMILRGRGRLFGALWLDAMVGRSTEEPKGADTVTVHVESTQAALRAVLPTRFGSVSGAARIHRADEAGHAAEASEVSGRVELRPAPWLLARGDARLRTLGGVSGVETEAVLRAGPFRGVTLVGGFAAGNRGIPWVRDTIVMVKAVTGIGGEGEPTEVPDTVEVQRVADPALAAFRAGAELRRGNITAGATYFVADADDWVPYGFVFDRGMIPREGETLTGVEAYASFPLLRSELRLDGWYTRYFGEPELPYVPVQMGRIGLEFNDTYRGGNLEPTLRLELVGRDETLAPDLTAATITDVVTPRYVLVNVFLQIRILDIRLFYRFDNLLNRRTTFDVPGTLLPGGRALFGVRWFFRN